MKTFIFEFFDTSDKFYKIEIEDTKIINALIGFITYNEYDIKKIVSIHEKKMNTQTEKNHSFLKGCILWFCVFVVLVFLCVICSSCNPFKRITKTKTITETVYYVDTVVIVKKDTITIYAEVPIYDTAFIETEIFVTKSYVDTVHNTIIIEAKGKEFKVPIKIKATEKTTEKKKEKEPFFTKVQKWILCIGLILIFFFFMLYLIKSNK